MAAQHTQTKPAQIAPRLFDQVRDAIRRRHYSPRTEQTYLHWIKRFILFSGRRHPREMGADEVTRFLSDLATTRHVAASTQNQALAALLFLVEEVLAMPLPWLDKLDHAKPSTRRPTVLTADEAAKLLSKLRGAKWLMASRPVRGRFAAARVPETPGQGR